MTIQTNGDDCRESGEGETSREQFEVWYAKHAQIDPMDITEWRDETGGYRIKPHVDELWNSWQASRCANEPVRQPYKLPDLNDALIDILGRPNFTCLGIANLLRKGGETINRKSEHEQAAVIHFLLGHYLQSGDGWTEAAENALREKTGVIHEQRNPPQT